MSDNNSQLRSTIKAALASFQKKPLAAAATALFGSLGYSSDKVEELASNPTDFITEIEEATSAGTPFQRDRIHLDKWKECAFLFQLTNDEIPSLAIGQKTLTVDSKVQRQQMESFVYLAIELKGDEWSRSDLAAITREFNKRFPMPAIILFKHGALVSLAVIDRRINRRDSSKDVIDGRRISIIKDIRCGKPHSAHLHILSGLAIENLGEKHRPTSFRELYEAWIKALSIQALNEKFYKELFYWYLYAVKTVQFPLGGGEVEAKRNSVAVIRLLTRLIFVWFIKEKGLVPDDLFERDKLGTLLKSDPATHADDSNYYLAVLQNLFFATLNVEMGNDEQGRPWRRWSEKSKTGGQSGHYLIHSVYRHKEAFKDPDAALQLYGNIPFLNGGLFECLDRELTDLDLQRNPDLKKLAVKEGNGWVLRIDGFSRRSEAQPTVPNKLFFGGEQHVDLNADLATKGKEYDVHGLIDIFNQYKFTVDENTPVEEEVALDPELLGKVFENLLASYNEDTKTTARKQTGSFYTPREVVDYMVDEALVAYFERQLNPKATDESLAPKLRQLLSYANEGLDVSDDERVKLIAAIERLTLLDPACGSGAFPMGALAKLVHLLKKLDKDNVLWRAQNRAPLEGQLREAGKILDPNMREDKVEEAEAALAKFDRDFSEANYPDYTRKLYLIEKCIHGVDIQPIAVQIAKLRFFISLIVSQKVDDTEDNRNITALPNLETKIVAADSLTPIDRPAQMGLRDMAIDDKEKELAAANEHYFAARTGKTKRKWRDRIFAMRDELANLLEKDRFLSKGAARQLVHWNPFDQNAAAGFFDPEWMFQITDGFDIVIGNPPYIKEATSKKAFDGLHSSPYYQGKMDIWYLFACQALDHLKRNTGVLSFIATNNWVTNAGASILRKEIANRTTILHLIDFVDYKVFGEADIQTMILVAVNNAESKKYKFDLRRLNKVGANLDDLNMLLRKEIHDGLEYLIPDFDRVFFASHTYTFSADYLENILSKIKKMGKLLLDGKKEIAHGIDVLQDYVNKKNAEVIGGDVKVGDGIFVLQEAEKEALQLSKHELQILKPYYTTKELGRYYGDKSNVQWIIYTSSKFKNESEMNAYPVLRRHLDKYKNVMTSDNAPYGLHRARDERFFRGEKILSQRKCAKPTFTYTDFDCYISRMFVVIKTQRVGHKYLTALLNSSVVAFWLLHKGKRQGHQYQLDTEPLENIPLIAASPQFQNLMAILVNIILVNKFANDGTSVFKIEQLLNGLVYELYFPEDLHKANIHLFAELEKAGVGNLASLEGEELISAASKLAEKIFITNHPIYGMLFDLQGLDVVRIIEGRE